jgi:hypothetical protein
MNDEERLQKVEALTKVKSKAEEMASKGADVFEVRNFINEGTKKLAFMLPDKEAFRKAARAAARQVKKKI